MLIMVSWGTWNSPQGVPVQQVKEDRTRRLEHGIAVALEDSIRKIPPGDRLETQGEQQ